MNLHKLMHHPAVAYLREHDWNDLTIFLTRFLVGTIFVYHGLPKVIGEYAGGWADYFVRTGVPLGGVASYALGALEVIAGLALIIGLATRVAGAVGIVVMLGAIFFYKGLGSWTAIELEMLIAAVSIGFVLTGAGKWSLDAWLLEKSRLEHQASLPVKKS